MKNLGLNKEPTFSTDSEVRLPKIKSIFTKELSVLQTESTVAVKDLKGELRVWMISKRL